MATLLHTTSNAQVPYIGINQDYAEWEGTPLVFDAPITSLWSEAGEGCEVCQQRDIPGVATGCNCGMVAMVFQRETLQSFLDWMEIKGRWKEKPVDWSLADFAQECGHEIVIKQTIKPAGSTSASMYALKEATRASNSFICSGEKSSMSSFRSSSSVDLRVTARVIARPAYMLRGPSD